MASSSASSVTKTFKYDVFLSFRGETRLNFVDHLNVALQQRNIYTYKDDEKMKKGAMINEDLIESIKDSKFHIIVFSKDYPSSSWCLDELVTIMECHKEIGHTAYPVFYDVKPSEVRDQKGAFGKAFAKLKKEMAVDNDQKGVFGKAFSKLKKEKDIESDQKGAFEKWREALKEAADLAGWELKKTADGHEAIFIQKIVEMVSLELRSTHFSFNEKLVGMESRIKDVLSFLGTGGDNVHFIGIKGMGGSGKTTLARALFDRISLQFEGKSFVDNVRAVSNASSLGLNSLQNQILKDVLNDQGMRVSSVSDGTNMLKRMMGGRKVILVLDDVDHMEQLEALAGDPNWFKPGSIIIITTRDEQVLVGHGVKLIHNINLLSNEEAVWLFSRYASRGEIPVQEYEELSRKVIVYAAGLPLTIKVLGSFLCGKSKLEWIDSVERLKKIPLEETLKKLELSFIGLEEEHKEIFLDVACILKYWLKDKAIQALESRGFHARIGLRVLEQKSLITTYHSYDGEYVGMHDHIEEMGRNIVRRLHPDKPNKHSRLWIQEEIESIFINDLGTEATKCIRYYTRNLDLETVMKGIRKMKELRFLDISWDGASPEHDNISPSFPSALRHLHFMPYPFRFSPITCEANNLVTLQLPYSNIVELWEGGDGKVLNKLRFLDLSYSKLRTLDLGLTPNVQTLTLDGCRYLERVDMPVALSKLRSFHLSDSKIRTFHLGSAPNLETLKLKADGDLVELYMPFDCPKLRILTLYGSTLRMLDLGLTPNLEKLDLWGDLEELYMPVKCLKLQSLMFSGSKLRKLDLGLTPNLEKLYLSCDIVELYIPVKCQKLKRLKLCGSLLRTLDLELTPILEELTLRFCQYLVELRAPNGCLKLKYLIFESLKLRIFDLGPTPNLEGLEFWGCYCLGELHGIDGWLKLKTLSCRGTNLKTLSLGLAMNLWKLHIVGCDNLVEIHMPRGSLNFKVLYLYDSKLRTLDIGHSPNVYEIILVNCLHLEELCMADKCQKLRNLHLIHTKLRTLDLWLAPNLEYLSLRECYELVELHMLGRYLNLKSFSLTNLKLRTLEFGLTPNLRRLYLQGCYNLVELHAPIECVKQLVYVDLSGSLRFRSFLFKIKEDNTDESSQLGPLAELSFSLERCPIHPDNNLPKFQFTCLHKEDLPSLARTLEKLMCGGLCACKNLERFSRSIFGLQSNRKFQRKGSMLMIRN